MQRNLLKRLEILFPVIDPNHQRRLIEMLNTCFNDNLKARRLLPEGTYEPVARKGRRIRAQEIFYEEAVEAIRTAEQSATRFRPLTRPNQ